MSIQQAVVAVVYVDQSHEEARESRLVVTAWLQTSSISVFRGLFVALCSDELHIQPIIVHVKRLKDIVLRGR
jgi:hypothetical protein